MHLIGPANWYLPAPFPGSTSKRSKRTPRHPPVLASRPGRGHKRRRGHGGDALLNSERVPARYGVLTDDRLAALRLPQQQQYRQRLAAGNGYDGTHRELLRALQREQLRHRNRPRGYWIAAADPAAARHARTLTLPASTVNWTVLATDGAVHTARHLGLDDWPALARSGPAALTRILERCQDWEEHADPAGRLFPRAKRHDDKTIVSVLTR